jgi:dienelactone hydrolase
MTWRKALCSHCLLALSALPLGAQSFLAWKELIPGPYAVGFTTATVVDATRTIAAPKDYLGRPHPGYGQRPVHVAIWQPAESATSGVAMSYGDYLPLLAWDTAPQAEGAARRQVDEWQYIQAVTPLAGPPDPAAMERLLGERVWARRDARPAPGRFPVLVYAPGMGYPAFDNSVLFEYLASHGYVVVASPSIGPTAGRMPGSGAGLEAQARDLEFLVGYVQTLPQADPERIGTAGFSWGGLSSVLLALRNARVRAVVSLDGVIRETGSLALARTFPDFRPERLRVPMLVFTPTADRATPDFADESALDQVRFAELTRAAVPGSDHHDFGSMSSLLRRASQPGKGRDWAPATAGYEAICELTLEFLDVHVKGGGAAALRPGSAAWTLCGVSTRRAGKGPPTAAELGEILETDGPARAIEVVRTVAKEQPEAAASIEGAINQAGYELLFAGRTRDAIAVLALGVEIAPESYNASDSLGEAYLAVGELDRARACYLDAKSKLEKAKDLSPEVKARYAASADRALAAIEAKRQK